MTAAIVTRMDMLEQLSMLSIPVLPLAPSLCVTMQSVETGVSLVTYTFYCSVLTLSQLRMDITFHHKMIDKFEMLRATLSSYRNAMCTQ